MVWRRCDTASRDEHFLLIQREQKCMAVYGREREVVVVFK